ncbi:BLUF domain-containing protein [Nocardioides sp.]|uniref:BLUF domain-containing protein n=1 Tax=Nocardioides sp. TaxID=35761 RepID=UPI0035B32E84
MTLHTLPGPPVLTLTYASSARELFTIDELVELVEQIRPKNHRLGVSGLLLYSGGNVIQTLEGEPGTVDALFRTIAEDPRHTGVRVLERRGRDDRAFASWSMGFRHLTAREIADTSGYTAFVEHSVGRDLDTHPESAFELLERFRATAV